MQEMYRENRMEMPADHSQSELQLAEAEIVKTRITVYEEFKSTQAELDTGLERAVKSCSEDNKKFYLEQKNAREKKESQDDADRLTMKIKLEEESAKLRTQQELEECLNIANKTATSEKAKLEELEAVINKLKLVSSA